MTPSLRLMYTVTKTRSDGQENLMSSLDDVSPISDINTC